MSQAYKDLPRIFFKFRLGLFGVALIVDGFTWYQFGVTGYCNLQ